MFNRPNRIESIVLRAILTSSDDAVAPDMAQVAWLAKQAEKCRSTTPAKRAFQLGRAWVKCNGKPRY